MMRLIRKDRSFFIFREVCRDVKTGVDGVSKFIGLFRLVEMHVAHCAFEIALSGGDNAHSFACVLLFPKISQKRSSTLNDLLQATMLCIRATNRTIVGYVRCARFPQMQALASLFACGQPEGVHAAGGTASPRRATEKKKNPIKSGSYNYSLVEMRGVEPLTS